jgi:hypothetical protein
MAAGESAAGASSGRSRYSVGGMARLARADTIPEASRTARRPALDKSMPSGDRCAAGKIGCGSKTHCD